MQRAAVLMFVILWAAAARAADVVPPGVLILHSNQRPTPAHVIVDEALRVAIAAGAKRPVLIYSEYLDDEWASLETYAENNAEFLHDKYARRNIRVIVAAAIPAMQFATKFRDRIVAGVPVVHLMVAADRVDGAALPADVVGNFEDNDPQPTLELALRLHPHARRIVVVRGASARDALWDERVRVAAENLGNDVTIEYLAGLPTADVLHRVAALPPDAIVYTPGYFVDGAGAVSTPRKSLEQIASASAVPVYGAFDTLLGAGIVGGYMTRYEDQAKEAAGIVVRLLEGTPPGRITTGSVARVPMVDWRQVQRWGVDERMLPAGTHVMFREPTAWDRYGLAISIAVAVLVLEAVLIAALLLQRVRRRSAEHASSLLAGQLLTVHEDERRRLARDLHDDVTQRLARLAIDAGRMERRQGEHGETARQLREELVRLSEDVHALSYRLHPSVLEDLGLAEGIKAECGRIARHTSIPVEVDVDDVPRKLPRESSLCLFRVAQEALRNVVRHARAQAIKVSVSPRDHGLQLVVSDDGQGFDTSRDEPHASLGRVSMRERVRLLGGRLSVRSAPGKGTTVTAWVPLEGAVR